MHDNPIGDYRLTISLRMGDRCESELYVEIWAKLFKLLVIKLLAIISYQGAGYAKSANNFFLEEVSYLSF